MSRENRIDGQKIPSLCRRIAGEVEIPFFLLTLGKAKSFDYMANVSAHMGVDSGVAWEVGRVCATLDIFAKQFSQGLIYSCMNLLH